MWQKNRSVYHDVVPASMDTCCVSMCEHTHYWNKWNGSDIWICAELRYLYRITTSSFLLFWLRCVWLSLRALNLISLTLLYQTLNRITLNCIILNRRNGNYRRVYRYIYIYRVQSIFLCLVPFFYNKKEQSNTQSQPHTYQVMYIDKPKIVGLSWLNLPCHWRVVQLSRRWCKLPLLSLRESKLKFKERYIRLLHE